MELIAENLDTVETHIQELARAERIHNPMAGGVKLSAWRGFTRKFAKEHLRGVVPKDFFPAPVPRYIRDYRAEEMGVASGRYLWALTDAGETLGQLGARRDAMQAEAVQMLGQMLFAFSYIDVNLGLCLVWVGDCKRVEALSKTVEGQNLHTKLETLSKLSGREASCGFQAPAGLQPVERT